MNHWRVVSECRGSESSCQIAMNNHLTASCESASRDSSRSRPIAWRALARLALPQRCELVCRARRRCAVVHRMRARAPARDSGVPCLRTSVGRRSPSAALASPHRRRSPRRSPLLPMPFRPIGSCSKSNSAAALRSPNGRAWHSLRRWTSTLRIVHTTARTRSCALPLAPVRQRERGFNQAREIAVHVARRTELAALGAARARHRGSTADDAALGAARAQRSRRLCRAFVLRGGGARQAHRPRRRRHDHGRHASGSGAHLDRRRRRSRRVLGRRAHVAAPELA